jgi:hypothetical protein
VNLWRKRKNHRAEITPILREIEEISNVFNSFEISYISRNANLAAHYCDKEASPCNPECMDWLRANICRIGDAARMQSYMIFNKAFVFSKKVLETI